MENYKHSAKVGQEIILTYLKEIMKEQKVTQEQLAVILGTSVTTLWRYFNMKVQMPLGVYLEICGALKLRPYLIPAEIDNTDMHRVFFN
jgi:transcriptional regulator with XRE-family HTH domain